MLIDETKFKSKAELHKFLVDKKDTIIAQKKGIVKHADGLDFVGTPNIVSKRLNANKANEPIDSPKDELDVIAIINTTNLMDSHLDVHIPGLWNKSLRENKFMMHLQEHKMAFDKIISDGPDLTAYAKEYTWKDLGFDFEGKTEGLTFDSKIRKERNEFMHMQYAKGYVKQHSVGMRYVKMVFCLNDEDYGAEFEAWEKYFPMVVNSEAAENKGYFWAVTEAKATEGSAVPLGSNYATPTYENNKTEPLKNTPPNTEEPLKNTLKENQKNFYLNLLK